MDKIEEFIKKNKGCPLTPAATKQLLVKFMEFMGKELPGMISEGSGSSLKVGNYIYNEDNKLVYTEDFPEDYTGILYYFGDDYFSITYYENGVPIGDEVSLTLDGVNKIQFSALTHSFNELDETLQGIIDSAISTGEAQHCTQAQWNAIKELLDKSLYINYEGYSMIKSVSDGIGNYVFGGPANTAFAGYHSLEIRVDENYNLYAFVSEI